jgi:hypothetical protein
VRIVRSQSLAPGTVTLTVTEGAEGEVVVACAPGADVHADGHVDASGTPVVALAVREGDVEVAIETHAGLGRIDGPSDDRKPRTETALSRPSRTAAPTIPEAEWLPIEPEVEAPSKSTRRPVEVVAVVATRSKARWAEADDGPTRIQPVDDLLDGTPSPRAARGPIPDAPVAARPRIRRGVRRAALFALLASAFMLWLHAIRLRHAHAVRARATAAAMAPSGAAGNGGPASTGNSSGAAPWRTRLPSSAVDTDKSDPRPATTAAGGWDPSAPRARSATVRGATASAPPLTPARVAADALANGAWGDALVLYRALLVESPADEAYARIVRSLEARAVRDPP